MKEFQRMSDEELAKVIQDAEAERERRAKERREKSYKDVVALLEDNGVTMEELISVHQVKVDQHQADAPTRLLPRSKDRIGSDAKVG